MGGGDMTACAYMVIVQLGYVGMNIIAKLAMNTGMSPFVQVAYRQLFATLSILPLAYFVERNNRPKMTRSILFQIFLCSIFGVTVNQITYFVGLKNSTPTIACALTNIHPVVTFIMAVAFRLEKIGVKTKGGQAKILGTVLCVGGTLFLSFYSGLVVILGPFLLILSAVSWAVYLIIQEKESLNYNVPFSCTAIMCAMATVQCVAVAFAMEPNLSAWSLASELRLISSIYAGVMCSAVAFCLKAWCIDRKGPLYVSVFSPLRIMMVAIVSLAVLDEKIYIGTVVGPVLIALGLYGLLWGKFRETAVHEAEKIAEHDMKMEEVPHPTIFNGIFDS
ncbi:WAT1-related protein At1g09380-like [Salvia hispanica]|uniref:WAT1-related protein At1g09380-like n=1 Tax=Salvia hispanica TaxID=49212 RepID=UPI00200968C6|nr:WAT1-related protein At1g09380-like [Salvia hispanica]